MIKQTTNVHIPLIAPLMHVRVLPLRAPFAIIKLKSHKERGKGTIKMIGRLYQLGDRSSHLGAGRCQSTEGVGVGVGSVGGPNPCLMFLRQKAGRTEEFIHSLG